MVRRLLTLFAAGFLVGFLIVFLAVTLTGCEDPARSGCRDVGRIAARSIPSQHSILIEGSPGNQECWIPVSRVAWSECQVGRPFPDCANIRI